MASSDNFLDGDNFLDLTDGEKFQVCFDTKSAALDHRRFQGWFSYVIENPEQTDSWCMRPYGFFHWSFAGLLAFVAVVGFFTVLSVGFIFLRRRMKRCKRNGREADAKNMKVPSPSITAVIPCYLPNEQDIIEETVNWIMHKVESPGKFEVLVVYNTPHELPTIEARLKELEAKDDWPEERQFRVMRVDKSTSKAANLNAALKVVKDPYVVIYDADHHPDRNSLLLLWEKMVRKDQDCVQGSYYMRNLSSNQFGCSPCAFPCLARIIDAEFFTDWFLLKLVTRTFFLGKGYFSGSNALWRTQVLAAREFSETAQTEDVDMAIQQLLDGRKIEFCPESRSGELAPINMAACWKQRLRWTIGWDETSLKHGGSFTDSGRLRCRARCGMVWTFLVRWVMMLVAVGSVFVGLPLTLVFPMEDAVWGKLITHLSQACFLVGAGTWLFAVLEAILQSATRGCQGVLQVFFVAIVSSPFGFAFFFLFSFALQLTSCFKICTGNVKGWEVTARAPQPGATKVSQAAAAGKNNEQDIEDGSGVCCD